MKRALVFLSLALVLAVSVTAGWIASDWPDWCHRLQWCSAGFPH